MEAMDLPRLPVPAMIPVRQAFPGDHVENVRGETCKRLLDCGLRERIQPGARIAITAGSRGMGGFQELVSGIVDAVKAAGGQPFIIPAMGSHGRAVPEGQTEILNLLGISEKEVGAPIRATMETIELGQARNGAVGHLDRFVSEADGVIVLGRVKTHPESSGPLASGLLKMVTIGLGKQKGAQEAHSHGLWDSVREVPKVVMPYAKIVFGVAVVENAFRQPVEIEVVEPGYDAFLDADERLLKIAKKHLAKLPIKELDVLVIDEIGKTITGTCMDPHVIGDWRIKGEGSRDPDYRRVVALSLTRPSLGNALGMGAADFTTERLVQAYDPVATHVNLLTATEPGSWNSQEACLPVVLPTDRDAIEVALYSALAGDAPRVCRIKSTIALEEFWVSESLQEEVKKDSKLTVAGEPQPLPFNEMGNLF